ncbi:4-hydroxy-tetrahydrodipicolinate reductase [Candidatus Gillettellia adelgis]
MRNSHLRLAITGASGRMGRQLIRAVQQSENVVLGAALLRPGSTLMGLDSGEVAGIGRINIPLSDNLDQVIDDFDVLIDFTCPSSTLTYLDHCVEKRKSIVIGTTGFNDDNKQIIFDMAEHIGIVFSANFSVGGNLVLKLLEQAAQVMGDSSDIEIFEIHHRHKVDAPSGTALTMGKTIAAVLGLDLKDCAVYAREGYTGVRHAKSIGFASLRGGDIIGDHSAIFFDIGERVEITHKVSSRMTFASGAVLAASWLYKRKKGLFNMRDVLNIN